MLLMFQSQVVWRPSSALRSNLFSPTPNVPVNVTVLYREEVKGTAVSSAEHSHISRRGFQLQKVMECLCRWHLHALNTHIHEEQLKNHNLAMLSVLWCYI